MRAFPVDRLGRVTDAAAIRFLRAFLSIPPCLMLVYITIYMVGGLWRKFLHVSQHRIFFVIIPRQS